MKHNNQHYQELLKLIHKLTYSRNTWEVFTDFLEMAACAISNSVDVINYEKREKQYLETIGKYSPEHQKLFPEAFAHLVMALEYELKTNGPTDILGVLFHELELHNKYKGQFFTPQNICDMMGKISLSPDDKTILEQGYISVSEPCCGSGAMVFGFAKAMRDNGYNYCKQMLVTAVDIDLKCVHMCYLQLSLYGIPAVVTHGNTLTMEEWSHWYTPVYIVDGWPWKNRHLVEATKDGAEEAHAETLTPVLKKPDFEPPNFEQLDIFGQGTE